MTKCKLMLVAVAMFALNFSIFAQGVRDDLNVQKLRGKKIEKWIGKNGAKIQPELIDFLVSINPETLPEIKINKNGDTIKSVFKKMIKNSAVIKDVKSTPMKRDETLPVPMQAERHKRGTPVLYSISKAAKENLSKPEIIGGLVHEHAHQFGYPDLDHEFAAYFTDLYLVKALEDKNNKEDANTNQCKKTKQKENFENILKALAKNDFLKIFCMQHLLEKNSEIALLKKRAYFKSKELNRALQKGFHEIKKQLRETLINPIRNDPKLMDVLNDYKKGYDNIVGIFKNIISPKAKKFRDEMLQGLNKTTSKRFFNKGESMSDYSFLTQFINYVRHGSYPLPSLKFSQKAISYSGNEYKEYPYLQSEHISCSKKINHESLSGSQFWFLFHRGSLKAAITLPFSKFRAVVTVIYNFNTDSFELRKHQQSLRSSDYYEIFPTLKQTKGGIIMPETIKVEDIEADSTYQFCSKYF